MISQENIKAVDSIAVVNFFPDAVSKGTKAYCRCPNCGEEGTVKGKRKGLQIVCDNKKNLAKCFGCGLTLPGAIQAYAFTNNLDPKKDFIRIIKDISERFSVPVNWDNEPNQEIDAGKPIPGTFAWKQLNESGLLPSDTVAHVFDRGEWKDVFPFRKGAFKMPGYKIDPYPDEMLIHYYDLEGRPKTYVPSGARSRENEYVRIRWSNPEAHEGPDGKPVKYQTPAGAKAEIYIPEKVRQAYKNRTQIDTLFIQEGEKKAEKACKHGIFSVAIQGIFNIGRKDEGLPQDIQYLTTACNIKNIVLLFDSDWNDLSKSLTQDDDVDRRPKQFAKAAIKFRNFVKTLHLSKINVDIWFGHINKNEAGDKGIDDLLTNSLKGREDDFKEDIDNALIAHDGKGDFVTLHNISTMSDYQILDFWHLNSKQEFFDNHIDILTALKSFRFDRVFYVIEGGAIRQAREFGTGKDFWEISYDEKGEKKISISVIDALDFLSTNGYRSWVDEENRNSFVRIDRGIISKQIVPDIQRFIFNYVLRATKERDVHELFAKKIESQLSPGKLNLLSPLVTTAGIPEIHRQRFYFTNEQITINEDGITSESLIGPVWEENLIKRRFKRVPVIKEISRTEDGKFNVTCTEDGQDCEFLQYLLNTSTYEEKAVPPGIHPRDYAMAHLVNKITCIGYLLRDYKSYGESKAVVAMDGRMSEVGDSNGRSGKSLIGLAVKQIISQATISGRKVDSSDQFIFNDVKKTTRNVFIDDIKVNFNIGDLYSNITGDMMVNVKQGIRFTIPFNNAPKIYITTNHAIKSEGDSTKDRIVYMAFSPFYSTDFSPEDDFGHLFFSQWDERQWTLFDNLMIECVMWYMRAIALGWSKTGHGLIDPPLEMINLRMERQVMGEAFLQWAEASFAPDGPYLNQRIYRQDMFNQFHKDFPGNYKFVSSTAFRKKLEAFCQFKGLHLNAHRPHKESGINFRDWKKQNPEGSFIGKEEKSQGKEYFTVSDGEIFF